MASEEEDQDLESLRVAVLASLKTKSQQASPNNDVASQSPKDGPDAAEKAETESSEVEEEQDEDEDALRRAALKATREIKLEDIPPPPLPQPTFKLTGNLIAIQPLPEEPAQSQLNPAERPRLPKSNKFARFASTSSESSSHSEEDSSEEDSDSDVRHRRSSDSSRSSSDTGSSSSDSDSSSGSSSRSSSTSRSSSSSSASSSSSTSSSGSSSSDSSDSDTSDSDKHRHRSSRDSKARRGARKRHEDRDTQRRHPTKETPSSRSERDRDRQHRLSPRRAKERDSSWSSRQGRMPGKEGRDYRSAGGRSQRDGDRLRTRSRSPRSRGDEQGLRTRPDGTRGFGVSGSKVPSASEPLESRLRRLAAHEDSRLDRKRDARELLSGRRRRSEEAKLERGVRRQNSNTSRKTEEKSDSKVGSPKRKRASLGSGADSSDNSDISLSDLESDSDKETSRFKHAKGEKPQNELRARRKPAGFRGGLARDDRRDDRRREERRRRDDDRYLDSRRQRGRSRDRDLIRKHDSERQRSEKPLPKSRNGPTSVVQSKLSNEQPAGKADIPSLLDIKIRNPNMEGKIGSTRLEPVSPVRSGKHRNRSFSPSKKLTSPDQLKIVDKNFESESGSDDEAVPSGPRSIVKVDKRRDLKSRLGKRASPGRAANHDAPGEESGRKKERDRKARPSTSAKKGESKKGLHKSRSEREAAREEERDVQKDSSQRTGSPEIRITFNEGPPSKRKPVHERLGLKTSGGGSKPRRSVKERLGKVIPIGKEESESKRRPEESTPHQPDGCEQDQGPAADQAPSAKPRQSVIDLKARAKRDVESQRRAEKRKLRAESRQGDEDKSGRTGKAARNQTEAGRQTKDEISPHRTETERDQTLADDGETRRGDSTGDKNPAAESNAPDGEVCDERKHLDTNDALLDEAKKPEAPAESKGKTKAKLRRSSASDTKTDDGKAGKRRGSAEEEGERAPADVRVSVSREEEMETSDREPAREVIRSQSPRPDGRKVVSDQEKHRRNIVSSEADNSRRQIVYSESKRSGRNVVPADYETSKRKIVHEKPDIPDSETSRRKILQDDSRQSRRKVYQSDLDSTQRKIVHGEHSPRRKILQGASDSSRRKVFQSDIAPPSRTVVEDSEMKRGLSPPPRYEDVRRPKMTRAGDLWKRDCLEEEAREVEMKMEQEERKVIERTREEEVKRRKEEELNARIRKIKEKNAAILQRHKEIEAEKLMFGT